MVLLDAVIAKFQVNLVREYDQATERWVTCYVVISFTLCVI
jgi:hypothetical protein